MIDQEWKATQAQPLGFDDEQLDTLLRIAARAYQVANKTTYDELAMHLLARTKVGRVEELKRMAVILGDDVPIPLTMRRDKCNRRAWWHVYYADRSDGFFCFVHTPFGVPGAKYAGVELCEAECVIIEEEGDDQA